MSPESIKDQEPKDAEIILTNAGAPFSTVRGARFAMVAKKLDSDVWDVVAHSSGNGFVIKKADGEWQKPETTTESTGDDEQENGQPTVAESTPSAEKYFWVKFSMSSDLDAPVDVKLSVNTETLTIKRGEDVILPERFIECADQTVETRFRQEPGADRKKAYLVHRFPFEKKNEATKEDYEAMKRAGTKAAKMADAALSQAPLS